MSVLYVILGFLGAIAIAIAIAVARALVDEEIKARIQLRLRQQLEATIASLPDELQAEWADEWRADLDTLISMPLSAARFVRGVRRGTREFVENTRTVHHAVLTAIFCEAPARAIRAEHRISFAGRLLPLAVRDRQIREWVDNLVCEHEAGGDPERVLRSILLLSVLPIAIGARLRLLGRVFARPR